MDAHADPEAPASPAADIVDNTIGVGGGTATNAGNIPPPNAAEYAVRPLVSSANPFGVVGIIPKSIVCSANFAAGDAADTGTTDDA